MLATTVYGEELNHAAAGPGPRCRGVAFSWENLALLVTLMAATVLGSAISLLILTLSGAIEIDVFFPALWAFNRAQLAG